MNIKPSKNQTQGNSQTARPMSTKVSFANAQSLKPMATLALAASFARKGELRQAEGLLVPFMDDPEAPLDYLDLLAKVYSQQGRIEDAQSLWLRALQREPSNTHFIAALHTCAEVQKLRSARFSGTPARWVVIGFSIAFIIGIVLIVIFSMMNSL